MSGSLLIYIASSAIKDYCAQHPINWKNRELACLGGPGDTAGMPPVPSVEIFLDTLQTQRRLFTQAEFFQASVRSWGPWCDQLTPLQLQGLEAKAYRNFYPSMIDSIHVWAMLVEQGGFDRCYLDSVEDHTGKTDLTVACGNGTYGIALQGRRSPVHRPAARGTMPRHVYTVPLPSRDQRPPGVGNKQWYEIDDFFRADGCFDPGWRTRHVATQSRLGALCWCPSGLALARAERD